MWLGFQSPEQCGTHRPTGRSTMQQSDLKADPRISHQSEFELAVRAL